METVQIKHRSADEPVNVLTLEEMNGPARIAVRWHDPTNLEIAYSNGVVIFQAIKVGPITVETVALDDR